MNDADKIWHAAKRGPIRGIGGLAYDRCMSPLMDLTRLSIAINDLARDGKLLSRTDAGGSPRWEIDPSCRPIG